MNSSLTAPRDLNLGFPYHDNGTASERLARIQRFMVEHRYDSEYLCSGEMAEALEEKIASILGTQAALWHPTGTMAQAIAARIHTDQSAEGTVLLHPTSHLMLHEEDGYKHAHGLRANVAGLWREPISADDINETSSCVFLELPQRHGGGRLPTWEELERLKQKCSALQIPLHMDGARLWACRPFYNDRPYSEICSGFSSVYVSFYKDIGAMGGAALAGDQAFIDEARIWRTRLGGLLVEPWPAIADALRLLDQRLEQMPGFIKKARALAASIANIQSVKVDPDPPHTNMFHVLLPASAARCEAARDAVAEKTGIWLSNRFWAYESDETCALEIVVGEKALSLKDEAFRDAVERLLKALSPSSRG